MPVLVVRERDTASITSRDNRVIITIGQNGHTEVRNCTTTQT